MKSPSCYQFWSCSTSSWSYWLWPAASWTRRRLSLSTTTHWESSRCLRLTKQMAPSSLLPTLTTPSMSRRATTQISSLTILSKLELEPTRERTGRSLGRHCKSLHSHQTRVLMKKLTQQFWTKIQTDLTTCTLRVKRTSSQMRHRGRLTLSDLRPRPGQSSPSTL